MQTSHSENYKILLQEIKDLIEWEASCVHALQDNIVKMAKCLKLIYRFNTIPIKSKQPSLQKLTS